MNMEIGNEAAQFDFWKLINRIFFAVYRIIQKEEKAKIELIAGVNRLENRSVNKVEIHRWYRPYNVKFMQKTVTNRRYFLLFSVEKNTD
jgi:hypothetical protein